MGGHKDNAFHWFLHYFEMLDFWWVFITIGESFPMWFKVDIKDDKKQKKN
jgi:hypothetical protein